MSNIPANNPPSRSQNRPDARLPSRVGVEVQIHVPLNCNEASIVHHQAVIRQAVQAVIATTDWARVYEGEIEIAIVDDARIHEINRTHLQHDWETDVISFPYEVPGWGNTDSAAENGRVAGELIVSWETAVREANATGWPPLTELILYVVHGTLHLIGMDDLPPQRRAKMRTAEQEIMEHLKPTGYHLYDVDHSGASS